MTLDLINERLDHLIPAKPDTLTQAARYALLGGGKRIRPLLVLAIVKHYGIDPEIALSPACSLEMIHAYSLIHDDLPCMDDDDFRRGIPTVHKKFNEAIAVLTGDYLLTFAFEVLSTCRNLTENQRINMITTLAQCAGSTGMIGGQSLDIEAENEEINLEALRTIHQKKTGCLFAAASIMGGIIANVDTEELIVLRRFGHHLGLAFQIFDDIKDVTNSLAKHGGNISSDVRNHKSTYVSLLGIEQAEKLAEKELLQASELLPLQDWFTFCKSVMFA